MKKSDIFVLFFKYDNVKVSSQEKLGILIFIIWFLTFPFFFYKEGHQHGGRLENQE